MTDKEAELIAIKVVEHFEDRLPCRENSKRINEHDAIINDGLKDSIKNIRRWVWGVLGIITTYGIIDKIF